MAWVDNPEWITLSSRILEKIAVAVVKAIIEGESEIGKFHNLNSKRLTDEGARVNSPTKGTKLSLMAMVCLKHEEEKWSTLRVL